MKNNLSLIKGILNLQSEKYNNNTCNQLIEDFNNRIDALASLHKTLYNKDNIEKVNLKEFIEELSSSLHQSFKSNNNVAIELQLSNYKSTISEAIPLGLIINEVITNSFKHAFTHNSDGKIAIELAPKNNTHQIIIHDNGIGIDTNYQKSNALGLNLIQDLTEQIDAQYSIENKEGTKFTLSLAPSN